MVRCAAAVAADAAQEVERNQRGRCAEGYIGAHLGQAPEIGARHPTVQQVTHYDDLQAFDLAEMRLDGEEVEKRLRGVRVHAVAGVDDGGIQEARQEVRRA